MAKKIVLENEELKGYLEQKGALIKKGIAKSEEIEKIELEMDVVDKKVQEYEATIDVSDLLEDEKRLSETVAQCVVEMDQIKKNIFARMKENAPQELYDQYNVLDGKKKVAEEERNKIAIKAQKFNDKIIPLGRELMTPFLEDEYDDYDTLSIEDGQVTCSVFNHLEEFKENFKKKKQ